MSNIVKKLFLHFVYFLAGRPSCQKLFEMIHLFSLFGMGFMRGGNPKNSGEINAIKYIIKKLHDVPALVIFDVGANRGDYTRFLLELLKDRNARIHVFEPSYATFNKLQSNLSNKKNVFLHHFGFGEASKNVELFYDSKESGLASFYKRRLGHLNIEMNLSENVEMRTIDLFCHKNKIKHVHFLKMDVEGYELNVLKGASHMIKNKSVDFIQFEFGGCNIDSRTFFQDFYYLLSPNYHIYRILGNGLYMINNYQESQEVFLLANYLAELKR